MQAIENSAATISSAKAVAAWRSESGENNGGGGERNIKRESDASGENQ